MAAASCVPPTPGGPPGVHGAVAPAGTVRALASSSACLCTRRARPRCAGSHLNTFHSCARPRDACGRENRAQPLPGPPLTRKAEHRRPAGGAPATRAPTPRQSPLSRRNPRLRPSPAPRRSNTERTWPSDWSPDSARSAPTCTERATQQARVDTHACARTHTVERLSAPTSVLSASLSMQAITSISFQVEFCAMAQSTTGTRTHEMKAYHSGQLTPDARRPSLTGNASTLRSCRAWPARNGGANLV